MPCTTVLVGKKASYDGSTMIARNDDSPSGLFEEKKLVEVDPKKQPRKYKSKIAKLTIELPDDPLRYTCMPNVDPSHGIWPAAGINAENVAMTATETITTNARVMGADPYVEYRPAKGNKKAVAGGIGEEDLVAIVLPYIHSAREGVERLGALLAEYGTYEPNGIAFSDKDEIWWLETIGGHHFIAKRVPDDAYVTMPNQFGLDTFDLNDAYGAQKENICSPDLKDFMAKNHLYLGKDEEVINPRLAFGSHDDSDHVYNTPRAWFIERYFNPRTIVWDGPNAQYTPESDDIPWHLVPEHKITVEDVKYVLSSHFQGTPYDPYGKKGDENTKHMYRPIGVNRTSFLGLMQIRGYRPKEIAAIEWIGFASNVFNGFVPFYTNTIKVPAYYGNTTLRISTDNFYWASRLLGALADPHFNLNSIFIERYQDSVADFAHQEITKIDAEYLKTKDLSVIDKGNQVLADKVQEYTDKALKDVLYVTSMNMKNAFARSDN